MDIQRLRIFIAVAQTGSLSRAGEKVHLSQPAVSLQIKQLQTEFGMTPFSVRRKACASAKTAQRYCHGPSAS